jgi:general secretion pathway protein C
VESLLRKYLWLLDLVAVLLAAIFLGRAASSLVEGQILSLTPNPKPAPRVSRSTGQPVYAKEYEPLVNRNVFCSTCPPLIKKEEPAAETKKNTEPQKTSLPLQLVAVNTAPPPWGFKWSNAILRDTDSKAVGAYGVGERVKGATITEIGDTRVHLDNAGQPEYLDLFEEPPAAAAPAAVAATPAAGASDPLAAELDKGIKKTGEHNYEIQRGTLESVLGNMNLLSRSARIVPEIRDGKAAGFRLYSVRPDGPFAKIGMQNGDVISSINGLEITSPEKALEVYAKLKSASHLSVGIERNGQRATKEYNIR